MKVVLDAQYGSNYSSEPYYEEFDTLREALMVFQARSCNEMQSQGWPGVSTEHCQARVWFLSLRDLKVYLEAGDVYPDEVWSIGPREGVRREKC